MRDCGVEYITAGAFAAKAVAQHPQKSNGWIAAKYGLSDQTIGRARKATVTNVTVEKISAAMAKNEPPHPKRRAAQSRREDRPPPIRHARASDLPPPPFPRASVRVPPVLASTRLSCFARSRASPSEGIRDCGGLRGALGVGLIRSMVLLRS
jgi:hypothetical protein